jgi:NADPH-dependent curcumin reductase CurA
MNYPVTARQVHLVRRPDGLPTPDDFRLAEVPLPAVGSGEVLVRNSLLSLSAAMRTLMEGTSGPLPSYQLGAVMSGPALGEVIVSNAPEPAPGDLVQHRWGWRDYAWGPAAEFRRLDKDAFGDPIAHLAPGLTAYVGLVAAGAIMPGDTVLVTGAAGAVGSLAGQIARLLGASQVIGTVGSSAKARFAVESLGYDHAVDYHDGDLTEQLGAFAPRGVDVVFDNVGAEQLQAAISVAKPRARIALCGSLAHQLGGAPTEAALDTMELIGKRITITGFTAADHSDLAAGWPERFATWLSEGSLVLRHQRLFGLDSAVPGLIDLLAGRHTGMVVVDLNDAHR